MAGIFTKPIVEGETLEIGGITLIFKTPTGLNYREYIRRISKLYQNNTLINAGDEAFKQEDGEFDVEKLHFLLDDNDEALFIQMAACTKHQYPELSWEDLIDQFRQNAWDELLSPSAEICRRILMIDEFEQSDEDEKKPSTPMKNSDTD